MNPYYHQPVLRPPNYTYGTFDPVPPVRLMWVPYDQPVPAHYPMPMLYRQPMQYVDEVAILNMYLNPSYSLGYQLDEYIEHLMRLELEADPAFQRVNTGSSGASGSGLSEEQISKRLHVYTEEGKMSEDCEVDVCSICLNEYEKKEKMGRLECGHRFHADCIKSWLLSKNACPMCRATALTV